MNKFEKWSDEFGKAWERLDPDGAMAMFSKDNLKYFETVFTNPCISWDEAYKLWEVVPTNQKDVKYWSEVLATNSNCAIIHWKVSRLCISTGRKQEFDGIFEIKLDQKDLCTYFKQWRSVKE
jgi:hypothetical protein